MKMKQSRCWRMREGHIIKTNVCHYRVHSQFLWNVRSHIEKKLSYRQSFSVHSRTIIYDIKKSSAKKSFHDFSFSPLSSCCDPGLLWETFLGGGQRQCDSWNCNKPIKGCLFSFKEILLLNSFKSSKRIGSWKSNSDSSCFRITLGPGLLQWIRFFLLGCSELSKARLVRFLSKETRWVALDWNIIWHRLYILLLSYIYRHHVTLYFNWLWLFI